MTRRRRRRPAWAGCLLAEAVAGTGPARAGDRISPGAALVGVGGVVSISHAAKDGLDIITGLQLLLHIRFRQIFNASLCGINAGMNSSASTWA